MTGVGRVAFKALHAVSAMLGAISTILISRSSLAACLSAPVCVPGAFPIKRGLGASLETGAVAGHFVMYLDIEFVV